MCRIFEEYGDERVAEAKIEVVEKLLRQNKLTVEEIADIADVPLEQVRQMAQKITAPVMA